MNDGKPWKEGQERHDQNCEAAFLMDHSGCVVANTLKESKP